MEDITLLSSEKRQDNTDRKGLKGLPFYILIEKQNKQIKIPCANESIAKRLLVTYSNNNSNCKVSLM